MGRIRSARLGASSLLVLAAALTSPAFAQDVPAEEEIVVTGIRGSLRDAIEVKRESPLVMEAISADDIGQLPDVTIAESLVRLPGLNGSRDRGNSSQAVIRGLGARLVLGTVNGRETASSEPDRNIRWEIYPSEVVSGVQVYKSQSADLIAGGVAGTVNISTVRPLEYSGPAFVLRGGPVYYEMGADIPDYDPYGYRASGSFVGRLNDRFAVALGVSVQNQRNAYPSVQGWGYNDHTMRPPEGASDNTGDIDGDGNLDPTPWGFQSEVKKLDQDRLGIMGAAQWRPTSDFTLTYDLLYSQVEIHEDQDQTVYANNRGNWDNVDGPQYLLAAGYTQIDGDVVAVDMLPFAGVMSVIADYTEDKTLFVTGLNGELETGALTLTGDLSYSRAERDNQWKAVRLNTYPAWMSYDMRDGVRPTVATSPDLDTIWPQANPLDAWGESAGPDHLTDDLLAVALDADYELGATGFTSFELGARLSGRTKGLTALQWFPQPLNVFFDPNGPVLSSYSVPEFDLPRMLTADFQTLADLAYGPGAFDLSNADPDLLSTWSVGEDVFEAYAKANFETEVLGVSAQGNFGLRLVDVRTRSDGYAQSTGGGALDSVSVSHEYSELLPSASINFHLTSDTILRFGAAQVIARPPLDELRAGRSLSGFAPFTGNAGNPELDPFKATQFDASWEWYFQDEGLLAIAAYYKDVESNIGWVQTPQDFGGTTYLVASPANGAGGSLSGLEVTFQTPFNFIPGLSDLGVYSNYAYVNSDLEEFVPITDPLDSAGLAEHTATLDFWYDNGTVEARIGAKYHSPFTVIYGWDGSQLQTLEAETVVDFSVAYRFSESLSLRFQANNLTDEASRLHRDNRPNRLGRYDIYGRRYMLDVAYNF